VLFWWFTDNVSDTTSYFIDATFAFSVSMVIICSIVRHLSQRLGWMFGCCSLLVFLFGHDLLADSSI